MAGGGWIGVDLDGTLAHYDGWKGPEHIGAPIAPMVERVKAWLADGREVRVFTARAHRGTQAAFGAIQAWCLEHIGQVLMVTCTKDYGMVELWDDRAVQVIPNTGQRADRADQVTGSLTCADASCPTIVLHEGERRVECPCGRSVSAGETTEP